jgi:hypothetical protein
VLRNGTLCVTNVTVSITSVVVSVRNRTGTAAKTALSVAFVFPVVRTGKIKTTAVTKSIFVVAVCVICYFTCFVALVTVSITVIVIGVFALLRSRSGGGVVIVTVVIVGLTRSEHTNEHNENKK